VNSVRTVVAFVCVLVPALLFLGCVDGHSDDDVPVSTFQTSVQKIGKYELFFVENEFDSLLVDHAEACLRNLDHPALTEIIEQFQVKPLSSDEKHSVLLISTTSSSVSLDVKKISVRRTEIVWEHLPTNAAMAAVFSDDPVIAISSDMLRYGVEQGSNKTLSAPRTAIEIYPISLDYPALNQSCYFLSLVDGEGAAFVVQLSEATEQTKPTGPGGFDRSTVSYRDLIEEVIAITKRLDTE
jgi:hypothetical protein